MYRLDTDTRQVLLFTSCLFWAFSNNIKYDFLNSTLSYDPIYYIAKVVSVCSFFNYVFYDESGKKSCIGMTDMIVVRCTGAFYIARVCFLIHIIKNNIEKEFAVSIDLQNKQIQQIQQIQAYLCLLMALLVPILYVKRNANRKAKEQVYVHCAALASLYLYGKTFKREI
jgi:hypothetical protein